MAEKKKIDVEIGATDKTGPALKTFSDNLKDLKNRFGESGGLGLAGKTLLGGGILAGVTAITRAGAESAAKIRDMADQMRRGELAAGEIPEKLALSLPVIGNIYSAARDLALTLSNSGTQIERTTREAANLNALTEARKASADIVLKSQERLNDLLRQELRARMAMGATAIGKEMMQLGFGATDRSAGATSTAASESAAIRAKFGPVIANLQRQLTSFQIPMAIGAAGDPGAGIMGGEIVNQKQIDEARAARQLLVDQIARMKQREAEEISKVNAVAGQAVLSIWKTAAMGAMQNVGDKLPSLAEVWQMAGDKAKENVKRYHEEMRKVLDVSNAMLFNSPAAATASSSSNAAIRRTTGTAAFLQAGIGGAGPQGVRAIEEKNSSKIAKGIEQLVQLGRQSSRTQNEPVLP